MHVPGDATKVRTVTVLPGHGIGPEVVGAAMEVVRSMRAPVAFEIIDNIRDKLTPEAIASLHKNKVALKGEFVTGVGRGTLPSINIDLRKSMQLYANVVQCFNIDGVPARHENVDIVVIRENMEGEYSGMEHEVAPGITESLKVMTREATLRIANYAFEYATLNDRMKVRGARRGTTGGGGAQPDLSDGRLSLERRRSISVWDGRTKKNITGPFWAAWLAAAPPQRRCIRFSGWREWSAAWETSRFWTLRELHD